MSTYSAMRTRILDEYVNESLTTAQVNAAIQTAIKHYERKPLYFNQKTGTFSTVASQEYYSSSDLSDIPNIVTIVTAKATSGTIKSNIARVDFSVIDDAQDGSVTGLPRMLAPFKQQLRLYPIPDAVYTVTLAYVYRFTALSADGDTNAWMVEGEELIRGRAKRTLALDILHDEEMAARALIFEKEAMDEILAEGRRRLSVTALIPDAMPIASDTFNINQG